MPSDEYKDTMISAWKISNIENILRSSSIIQYFDEHYFCFGIVSTIIEYWKPWSAHEIQINSIL